MAFRVYYFAELLPNTFYLKDLADVHQGWLYLHQTLATYGGYLILAGFGALLVVLRARGTEVETGRRIVLWAVAAVIAAYLVRVGGDPRHFRYLAFSYCLAVAATAGLAEHALAAFAPRLGSAPTMALGLVLAAATAWCYPPQLSTHPLAADVQHEQVDKINDAHYHRLQRALAASP